MEHRSLDPYEQQLLKVFDSYDHDNCGSLDKDGLTQLCHTLQLEEQSADLIKSLLKDPKSSRATFTEFKEALLALLGSMQNGKTDEPETDKHSPDREVSPKYVYGSKKYGRKSRPKNDEISATLNDENNIKNTSVQRSNSQSDVSYSKKRKTNYKLKRCTSFPGNYSYEIEKRNEHLNRANEQEFLCNEEMLREAWKKLGVGEDGYLNQNELILVCEAIGLHELAKKVLHQLSNKTALDYNYKISFEELLEILQQDEIWSDILNETNDTLNLNMTNIVDEMASIGDDSVFPNQQTPYVMLGPDGLGTVNTNIIIEMWENAGITSPKLLLHDLGFNSSQINVIELASVLEKEIKGISESNRSDYSNPHVALLQATLTLYQSEIRCLKTILEQMHAEREKLKGDVLEANNRATLLAQEVDDNHAKMEQNTQNQVKLLEQRHSDILKNLTKQMSCEKEQISSLNQKLEQKIQYLESEEVKLKNDLLMAQKYSVSLERENQILMGQVSELQQVKNTLSEQIGTLEIEKQKYSEIEIEQIEPLLTKLAALQVENSQLRDKNDEMMSEIENLNKQVSAARAKISNSVNFNTLDRSMEENISVVCEGVGIGAKRRNDESPSKEINSCGLGDGSPRLGKIRKFHKNNEFLEVPFTSSESGFDADLDCFDSSLSASINESEEIARLQAKIARLEQILVQHAIPVPSNLNLDCNNDVTVKINHLTNHCKQLESIVGDIKVNMNQILNKNCDASSETLKYLIKKFDDISNSNKKIDSNSSSGSVDDKIVMNVSTETECDVSLEEKIMQQEETNNTLMAKCEELENCIELLRNEYERCEDYWSAKLEEERQMFEQEQNQNSEKLAELINKMTEYEEQFAENEMVNNRLPPIEEKYNLEKQFTDLEQEYEKYREIAEKTIEEKNSEILILNQKLSELSVNKTKTVDVSVQVEDYKLAHDLDIKMNSLSNHLVESTNLFSADTMPFGWNIQQSPVDVVTSTVRSECNASDSTKSLHSETSSPSNSLINVPSTSNSDNAASSQQQQQNNVAPSRPKRTRKYDRNVLLSQRVYNKKNNQERDAKNKNDDASPPVSMCNGFINGKTINEDKCVLPVSTIHNLNAKLNHLERRCRHLQMVLKQQHYNAEQMLQCCWQQYRGEKSELQYMLKANQEKLDQQIRICNEQLERLAKTDMLVKDLYVENSYLIANVQRLEQQCYMLAQCNSNNSSV